MEGDVMATIATWTRVDEARLAQELRDVCERLHGAEGEVLLDLSSVRRIGSDGVVALGELAARADEMGVKVALRGVSAEVYKVLKLLKLAARFVFAS